MVKLANIVNLGNTGTKWSIGNMESMVNKVKMVNMGQYT